MRDFDQVPGPLRAAALLVLIESAALVCGAVYLVYATAVGRPNEVARSLLLAAMALCGAAALGFGARGLVRLSPSARSPIVVLQLVALPVGYSLGIQAGRIWFGGPILVIALATLFLLFTPPSREALDRQIERP